MKTTQFKGLIICAIGFFALCSIQIDSIASCAPSTVTLTVSQEEPCFYGEGSGNQNGSLTLTVGPATINWSGTFPGPSGCLDEEVKYSTEAFPIGVPFTISYEPSLTSFQGNFSVTSPGTCYGFHYIDGYSDLFNVSSRTGMYPQELGIAMVMEHLRFSSLRILPVRLSLELPPLEMMAGHSLRSALKPRHSFRIRIMRSAGKSSLEANLQISFP